MMQEIYVYRMTLYPSSIGLDPIFCKTNANAPVEFKWEQNQHLSYMLSERIVCNKCISLCSVSMRIFFRHFSEGSILISFAALGYHKRAVATSVSVGGIPNIVFLVLCFSKTQAV